MSLAHSRAPRHRDPEPRPVEKEGWTSFYSVRSENLPRFISQPKSGPDKAPPTPRKAGAKATGGNGKDTDDPPISPQDTFYYNHKDKKKPHTHPHGNAKPSEPPFLQRRNSKCRDPPRMAGHMHKRPWTSCPAPGRKENPHQENVFHRVWLSDCGVPGRPLAPAWKEFATEKKEDEVLLRKNADAARPYDQKAFTRSMSEPRRWTKAKMKEHYEKSDQEMTSLKCADEMFAHGTNAKMWTHLMNSGVTAGGGLEKLDVTPKRKTGLHLKSGIYKGKYDNVRHSQVILCRRRKHGGKEGEDHAIDARTPFDNRLRDDMIRANDKTDVHLSQGGFDISRPLHTRSCPQMGAEWMNR